MAVPVRAELKADLDQLGGRLVSALSRHIERRRTELRSAARALPRPAALMELKRQRFDMVADKLDPALLNHAAEKRGRLLVLAAGLKPAALTRDLRQKREQLTERASRLAPAAERVRRDRKRDLENWSARLEALSHQSVLKRGFVLVRDRAGKLVRSGASLMEGAGIDLVFADVERAARIEGDRKPSKRAPETPALPKKSKPKPKPRSKPEAAGQGRLF